MDATRAAEIETSEGRRTAPPFVRRLRLRNYKSIAYCDIELGALTLLVGRNWAGESNVLDALGFVSDATRWSIEYALRQRGGVDNVRRRSAGSEHGVMIGLELGLGDGRLVDYEFWVVPDSAAPAFVPTGDLEINSTTRPRIEHVNYLNAEGRLEAIVPPQSLSNLSHEKYVSGQDYEIHIGIKSLSICNLVPKSMQEYRAPDLAQMLSPDGRNVASIARRLLAGRPEVKERMLGYLRSIVPEIIDFEPTRHGPIETLRFFMKGESTPLEFYPSHLSDGTLRAFGALVAIAQLAEDAKPVRLVGIEEPETALHPAASGALMDALREAAVHTQVVVTTHSPDLLDEMDPATDRLLVVESRNGVTEIGPIDQASRRVTRERLYSPGELLRMDQLAPDEVDLQRQRESSRFESPG